MQRIDAFLTGIAQRHFPDSLVICANESTPQESWILQRSGADLILGRQFKEARRALELTCSAHAQRVNITSEAAQVLGKKGGSVTSEAKAKSSRENGKKGGKPAKARPQTS
ncbi:hypothetical protein [Caudoviricetes sp.]|nr:hypothetical protein [Caudoviricetes sp.]